MSALVNDAAASMTADGDAPRYWTGFLRELDEQEDPFQMFETDFSSKKELSLVSINE